MDAHQLMTEKRNITIHARRTSLQLERYIWANFEAILDLTGLTIGVVIEAIDERRNHAPLAQTVRLFCMIYFRLYLDELTGGLDNLRERNNQPRDRLTLSEAEPMDGISCYYQTLRALETASRT